MRVAAAVSGGLDSAVALFLLKMRGYETVAFTLRLFEGEKTDSAVEDAAGLCAFLGVEHVTLDAREEFERLVVEPFAAEYAAGRTPNPCVLCNERVKFGLLREKAREMGCDALATGHYARVERREGEWSLLKAARGEKDQSYALYRLKREDLPYTLFPLGEWSKGQARKLARAERLPVSERPESQDICFVEGSYREFLAERGVRSGPGVITDTSGRVLGEHEGVHLFTIGQRRNLGLGGGGGPYYVVELLVDENRVIVGSKEELAVRRFEVGSCNWLAEVAEGGPVACEVKVRYRSPALAGEVVPRPGGKAEVRLDIPHEAVTPGQSAVFYRGDRVLGGGIIERVERDARE